MSGIFGFSFRSADRRILDDAIGGLEYWNRIYGDAAHAAKIIGSSGIGCHIEHFSERFPHGAPIQSLNGAPAVVDALLYNRDELLPMLGLDADDAISDEALLLRLIEQKGYSALRMVNGDFAGAVFDGQKQEWTLFRDHMGVRTLYYYMDDDRIVFSTDMRGILSVPGVDCRVNEMYLFETILGITNLSQTATEYQNICCVHPGSITRLRLDAAHSRFREKLYWKVRQRKIRFGSDEAYRAELRRLITDAVNRRCDAIPGLLGAELSGGLDSSVIDILINRHGRDALYYSWCTSPERRPLVDGDDERRVIMAICEQENITCKYKEPEEQVYFSDELSENMPPFINTTGIISGSRWIKEQGASVVFSGHGGDEGVSHRCNPFELLWNREIISYFRVHWMYVKGRKLRLLRALWSGVLDARKQIHRNFRRPTREELVIPIFDQEFNERMIRAYKYRSLPFRYAPHQYVRQGGSRFRLDNCAFMGAFCGVRYLFPYIDYRVMDFALSIPRRLHINHETSRLIFRETFADLMPKSLREVQYKDLPSLRNTNRVDSRNELFHKNVDYLLEKLDPDAWNGIIDFNGLRELHQNDVHNFEDIGVYNLLIYKLRQWILIQNIQKNAARWRELDEENKVL